MDFDDQSKLTRIIKDLRVAVSRNDILTSLRDAKELSADFDRRANFGSFYSLGETLLAAATSSFFGQLTKKEYDDLFLGVFTSASPVDVLLLLQKSLTSAHSSSAEIEKCVLVTAAFVKSRISALFASLCDPIYAAMAEPLLNSVSQSLVSLPTSVANVLKGKAPKDLRVENFCRTISMAYVEALNVCRDRLRKSVDCSLKFHSNLIGKLQICGYTKFILPVLIPFLGKNSRDDFVWTRLAQRLLTGVAHNAVEGLLTEIILLSPGKICLSKLLGDAIVNESKIRHVLTKKLIFTRYFDDVNILQTIFDYLSNCSSDRTILTLLFLDLLQVWSSESSTQSSFQQHFYISQAIIAAVDRLKQSEIDEITDAVTTLMLRGIQNHLRSSRDDVRRIGMVLGEILTKYFATNGGTDELKFDYADDERTLLLKSLTISRDQQQLMDSEEDFYNLESLLDNSINLKTTESEEDIKSELVCDSDDDLEPYEMPSEKETFNDKSGKITPPVYLRDCLNILLENKDVCRFESAFFSMEQLVRRDSPGLSDLAVEIAQILLTLEDRYSTDNFHEVRQKCMVAVCVRRPLKMSNFLTSEFYAKNYCLQHRMDILDVLRIAAKELSNPPTEIILDSPSLLRENNPAAIPSWREIVQNRINEKTRRFSQKSKAAEKQPRANRFNALAPQFFYPLLAKFDRPSDLSLDLTNRDFIVLIKLLYTVGSLMLFAENCPDCLGMASCLIEFAWNLRRHKEPSVRQGVLYCLIAAVTSVPPRLLASQFSDSLIEVKFWLEDACSNESDEQCKDLALRTLTALHKQVQEGLTSMIEIAVDG